MKAERYARFHDRRPSAVLLALVGLLVPAVASAQPLDFATCTLHDHACTLDTVHDSCCTKTFDAGSLIIPMDRCHQPYGSAKYAEPGNTRHDRWCVDPGTGPDEGIFKAYGLVYRAMQQGIPVYWVINATKDPQSLVLGENFNAQNYSPQDVDAWVVRTTDTASSLPAQGAVSLSTCATLGLAASCGPVEKLSWAGLGNANAADDTVANSYGSPYFPLRGGAFVIDAGDAAAFKDLYKNVAGRSLVVSGVQQWDFSLVDIYQVKSDAKFVYQDYRDSTALVNPGGHFALLGNDVAPIAVTIDYLPPRVARESPAGVSETWLKIANMRDPAPGPACLTDPDDGGSWPTDAIYCDVTDAQVAAGALIDGKFDWAWFDNWSTNATICDEAAEIDMNREVREFMTAVPDQRTAGHVLFIEKAVDVVEHCTHANGPQPAPQGKVGVGIAPINQSPETDNYINRYPQNLFIQYGDWPNEYVSGAVGKWQYWGNGALGYDPMHTDAGSGTLMRLLTEDRSAGGVYNSLCSAPRHKRTAACDIFANNADADIVDYASYVRYQSNPINGIAFYLGGNNVVTAPAQFRTVLNTLLALPAAIRPQEPVLPETRDFEVSRSSPVIAAIDGVELQVQGSFVLHDPAPDRKSFGQSGFTFPYLLGHLRGVATDDITTEGTALKDLPAAFDATDRIPAGRLEGCGVPFTAACRTVFTNLDAGQRPARTFFSSANRAAIKPLFGGSALTNDDADILMTAVIDGHLGGIDRSTAAVIESSAVAGEARPTMIYVGAADGMLHAICAEASVASACETAGQELWAYIPRAELAALRSNSQRIDGSPKVADLFGDFVGEDGVKEWRTILSFQTGTTEPAVVAIDVTDPADPVILWDLVTPGSGLGVAMGAVSTGGATIPMTIIQTADGDGSFYAAGIDSTTGELIWEFPGDGSRGSPVGTPRSGGNPPVPSTGIPAGPSAYDADRQGAITHVVLPSLRGELWVLDAADGSNPHGTAPLFRFSTDFHPIGAPATVYRDSSDGELYALVASGGYADSSGSLGWSPDGVGQMLVSVGLGSTATTAVDESSAAFTIQLDAGQRVFAQAVVAGTDLFVTTDSSDVNLDTYGIAAGGDTGQVRRYSIAVHSQIGASVTLSGGASAVDIRGNTLYTGSGATARKSSLTEMSPDGLATEIESVERLERDLWLRLD